MSKYKIFRDSQLINTIVCDDSAIETVSKFFGENITYEKVTE